MEKINNEYLDNIVGGATISGAVISALYKSITYVLDAGRALGSALRRISYKNMCPMK